MLDFPLSLQHHHPPFSTEALSQSHWLYPKDALAQGCVNPWGYNWRERVKGSWVGVWSEKEKARCGPIVSSAPLKGLVTPTIKIRRYAVSPCHELFWILVQYKLFIIHSLAAYPIDANEANVLSEGKRAVYASVIETQDIIWTAWFHQRSTSLFKVVTCRIARRLPRAAFGCGYVLIGCYYYIPKQPIIRIDSFHLTNHLGHPSHPSHLIVNWPRPSHPTDSFKIRKWIFQFLFILLFSNTNHPHGASSVVYVSKRRHHIHRFKHKRIMTYLLQTKAIHKPTL